MQRIALSLPPSTLATWVLSWVWGTLRLWLCVVCSIEDLQCGCCVLCPSQRHKINSPTLYSQITGKYASVYTPSQRGNYHHSMLNPTAAVNLFHVGKQYLTLCKAEAAVTRNLIGRKIISNVKHADARNSLPILDVIRSSHKRHSASEYCK